MIFEQTKLAAKEVAVAVSLGADYHQQVASKQPDLRRLPGCTMTDMMRFSVECQDMLLLLLRAYAAAHKLQADQQVWEPVQLLTAKEGHA